MSRAIDWNYLRSFVMVSEHGSLSAAARATGSSQPTLSRHIATLESQLNERLFERNGSGVAHTDAGMRLIDQAKRMADAADHISLMAGGLQEKLGGTIRITASQVVATFVLPDILSRLRREEPDIDIELVASDRTDNLLRREADIAIRMYRPTQADVITRRVADLAIGMFAARSYIDRKGTPAVVTDLLEHEVIGYDKNDAIVRGLAAAGLTVDSDFFAFRSDDQVVCWHMVVAGFGIGFNQIDIGLAEPRVARIETEDPLPALPVWLTAHSALGTSRIVRHVYDFLAASLANVLKNSS